MGSSPCTGGLMRFGSFLDCSPTVIDCGTITAESFPGTPKEQVQMLRDGMSKTFRDPEFQKEYRKLMTGDDVSPLTPEAQQETIRSSPRDAETVVTFNLINGNKPLPSR